MIKFSPTDSYIENQLPGEARPVHFKQDYKCRSGESSTRSSRSDLKRCHYGRMAVTAGASVSVPLHAAVSPPRLMLHAAALAFSDDGGNGFEFEAPLPSDFTYPQR